MNVDQLVERLKAGHTVSGHPADIIAAHARIETDLRAALSAAESDARQWKAEAERLREALEDADGDRRGA